MDRHRRGGIYSYDLRRGTVSNMSTANGLPSNVVSSLVYDGRHNLWMGTDRGLACLKGGIITNINYMKRSRMRIQAVGGNGHR